MQPPLSGRVIFSPLNSGKIPPSFLSLPPIIISLPFPDILSRGALPSSGRPSAQPSLLSLPSARFISLARASLRAHLLSCRAPSARSSLARPSTWPSFLASAPLPLCSVLSSPWRAAASSRSASSSGAWMSSLARARVFSLPTRPARSYLPLPSSPAFIPAARVGLQRREAPCARLCSWSW